MRLYRLLCISLVVSWAVACGASDQVRRLDSALCKSLVIRTTAGIRDSVICVLPAGVSPLSLVPPDLFGNQASSTLAEHLHSLPAPAAIVGGGDGTQFNFQSGGRRLQAACLEGSGPFEGKCYWELRSVGLTSDLKLHSQLAAMIKQVAEAGVSSANIDLIPGKPAAAQGSSVHLEVTKGEVTEARWTDPFGTMGVSPAWAKTFN